MPRDNAYLGIQKAILENNARIEKLDKSSLSFAPSLFQFVFFSAVSPACIYFVFQEYNLKFAILTALFFFGAMGGIRIIYIQDTIDLIKQLNKILQIVLDEFDEQSRKQNESSRQSYSHNTESERSSENQEEQDSHAEKPDETSNQISAFDVLGIEPTTDKRKIRKAYIRKMKKCHPDKGGSTEDAKQVNAAYEYLMAA